MEFCWSSRLMFSSFPRILLIHWSTVEMIPHEFCAWSLEAFQTKLLEHPFGQVIFISKSWTQVILGGFPLTLLILGFLINTLGRSKDDLFHSTPPISQNSLQVVGAWWRFVHGKFLRFAPPGPIPQSCFRIMSNSVYVYKHTSYYICIYIYQ